MVLTIITITCIGLYTINKSQKPSVQESASTEIIRENKKQNIPEKESVNTVPDSNDAKRYSDLEAVLQTLKRETEKE